MNFYLDVTMSAEQKWDQLREVETERVLRRAGIVKRGWCHLQICHALSHLGDVLVVWGKRLQGYALPPMASGPDFYRATQIPAGR